jgi:TetR/AcrR family transcriptional regulator, copper-responsive repressor
VTATTRGRPRSFDRDAALDAAMRLFWTRGYEATSIADLTEAMGIKPPSLYGAFGDKQALFREAVKRYWRTLGAPTLQALDAEPTAYGGFAAMLHALADEYTDGRHPPGCLVITAGTCLSPGNSEAREALRAVRSANRRAFGRRLHAAVEAGELPSGTDAAALAAFYATVIQGMSQRARDGATAAELHATAGLALNAWPGRRRPAPAGTGRRSR